MARRIILHIGRHKCGTSSIQKTLYENRRLLADHGYHYPDLAVQGGGHHPIGRAIAGEPTLLMSSKRRVKQQLVKVFGLDGCRPRFTAETSPHKPREIADHRELSAFLEDIRRAPQDFAIVSSEAFQDALPQNVAKHLAEFDVHPVCYLREQASYLRSAYTQRVQATDYCGSIEDYYRIHFRANYLEFLDRWLKSFGDKLMLRVFERGQLQGGDAVTDFLMSVLQFSPEQLGQYALRRHENPSLSREMLAFKLALNRRGYRVKHRIYRMLEEQSCIDGNSFGLTRQLGEAVQSRYRKSNAAVARRFFQRKALFEVREGLVDEKFVMPEGRFDDCLKAFEERSPGCIEHPANS